MILTLAFVEYFLRLSTTETIKDNIKYAQLSHQLTASMQYICTLVQDLKYIELANLKASPLTLKSDLKVKLDLASNINTQLTLAKVSVGDEYSHYGSVFESGSIVMHY
jgi:hypothetical protein